MPCLISPFHVELGTSLQGLRSDEGKGVECVKGEYLKLLEKVTSVVPDIKAKTLGVLAIRYSIISFRSQRAGKQEKG